MVKFSTKGPWAGCSRMRNGPCWGVLGSCNKSRRPSSCEISRTDKLKRVWYCCCDDEEAGEGLMYLARALEKRRGSKPRSGWVKVGSCNAVCMIVCVCISVCECLFECAGYINDTDKSRCER